MVDGPVEPEIRLEGGSGAAVRKGVADGIATREDVDKAMINGRNWPVGFYGSRGVSTGWLE